MQSCSVHELSSHIIIMSHHAWHRIKHATTKNSTCFETPYLAEVSSHTNATLENTNLSTNLIVHPKNKMHYLLKIIKCSSIFSDDARLAIMRTLMRDLEDANDNECSTEECFLKITMDTMIDEGIKNKIMERKNRWNRNDASNHVHICNMITIRHKKI